MADEWEDVAYGSDEWEDVTPDYSTASDLPASIAKKSYGGILNSIGGVVSGLEEYGKYLSPVSMFQPDIAEENRVGDDIVNYAQGVLKDANDKYQFEPGSASYYGDMVGSTVAQTLPVMLSGPAAAPLMLAQQAGSDYGNALSEGQTDKTALARAALNAPVNYLANKFTLGALTKKGSSLPKRILESELTNVATSPFQTVSQTIVNSRTGQGAVSPEDFTNRIVENLITDAGVGVVSPLAAHPFVRASARKAEAAEAGRIEAMAEQMRLASEAEASNIAEINQIVDSKTTLPSENVEITNQLQDAAQFAPDNGPRIIDFNPDEPTGIVTETTSARTPEFQEELRQAARPQSQLIVDESGRPLNAPPVEPSGEVVAPFTKTGDVRKALPTDEQKVIKELKLAEQRRKQLEAQALPTVVKPEAKTPEVSKVIDANTFPKVQKFVKKNVPDKGAQEGFVNALKLQREAVESGKPLLLEGPKAEAAKQIEQIKAQDPNYRNAPPGKSMVEGLETVEVPTQIIELSRDVPNFKSGSNERGIVDGQELKANKYDRRGLAPIIVWQRLDGRLEVVSGRHRLDLAKRLGEKTIPSQVVKESDGFGAKDALTLDAELNIRDGQGSVSDYATYFKEAGINETDAQSRGLLDRAKGSQGYDIGTKSSPELFALYNAGRISEAKAAAIAKSAAGNSDLQRVGIKEAKTLDADALSTMLRRLSQDPTLNNSNPSEQIDIFGANDSALNRVRDESRVVGDIKKQIQTDITAAYDAAKNPEAARRMGVDPKDPESTLKRIQELKTAKDKWEEFWKYPELRPELEKRIAAQATVKSEVTKKRIKSLKGQRGMAATDLLGIEQAARALGITNKDIAKTTHETLDQKETQDIIRQYGKIGETGTDNRFAASNAEKLLDNHINRAIVFPETVGKKSQWFKDGLLKTARSGLETRDTVGHNLSEAAAPYFKLGDTSRVDEALAAARKAGTSFIASENSLKTLGLSDAEVQAFLGVRKAMDSALDVYKDTLIAKGEDPADAEMKVDQMKKANYVPFSRFGEFFVRAYTPDGKTAGFWMFENQKQMALKAADLNKNGINTDSGEFKENPDTPGSDGVHPGGFGQHLLQSFEVAGYNKNLKRNIASYIASLAQHAGRTKMQVGFKGAFENAPANSPSLIKYAKDYSDYMLSNNGEAAAFRQALTAMYLGLNLKSAMVNMTQQVTTTLPKSIQYLGIRGGVKAQADAYSLLTNRIMNPEKFAVAYPELNLAIDTAIKQGTITEQGFREMAGRARSSIGETSTFDGFVNKTMIFFDAAEKANRYTSFVTGFNIAKQRGLSGNSALEFAKQFTTDTQFDYSKVNRPRISRGKIGAPLLTFKLFTGNYLRFLRDVGGGPNGAKAFATAVGAMATIGGVAAFPFMKELMKASELAGFAPKGEIKKALGKGFGSDLIIYGLPFAAGLADLSGSAGVGEIVPFPDEMNNKGFFQAAGKTILGVPGDLASRGFNAYERYSEGDTEEAVQALLPEAMKNVAVSASAAKKGAFTNNRGARVLDNPSMMELGLKAIGVTPKRLRENYDILHELSVLDRASTDNDNINHKIARAKVEGGDEAKLRRDHLERNKKLPFHQRTFPDPDAIKKMVLELKDPIKGAIKNLPTRARAEGERISKRTYP